MSRRCDRPVDHDREEFQKIERQNQARVKTEEDKGRSNYSSLSKPVMTLVSSDRYMSYVRQLLRQLLLTIDAPPYRPRSDHRLLSDNAFISKHRGLVNCRKETQQWATTAAAECHSPSQSSEVQLNTPRWQTLGGRITKRN